MSTMREVFLEACVTNIDEALHAQEAGAHRLELCGNGSGGTTPDWRIAEECIKRTEIPVHIMIRPHSGGFVYSDTDMTVMLDDIYTMRDLGASGIVAGVLDQYDNVDTDALTTLLDAKGTCDFVFHRAFDKTGARPETAELLLKMGVYQILTSGGPRDAELNTNSLSMLNRVASHYPAIIAAGGIRAWNVGDILAETGVSWIHANASDPDLFRNLAEAIRASTHP